MYGCMFREDVYMDVCSHRTHIVQSTYSKLCRWCVLVSSLSVLHRFSSQFGYISLIVALPYSFTRGARFFLYVLSLRRCSYFVHNVWKKAVFINIRTVINSPLVPLGGLSYSPVSFPSVILVPAYRRCTSKIYCFVSQHVSMR
jgi:hypothetical protein